jgi:hypothetical protein
MHKDVMFFLHIHKTSVLPVSLSLIFGFNSYIHFARVTIYIVNEE